jgi:Cu+-exporting ATPase
MVPASERFTSFGGRGVSAVVEGEEVLIGNQPFLEENLDHHPGGGEKTG